MSRPRRRVAPVSYGAIEDLVAVNGIAGAVEVLADDDRAVATWSEFLEAAAFAVDRQETAPGRRRCIRQLAIDDEDPAIASAARAHARRWGFPALHLIDGSSQQRGCDAVIAATHDRDVRHLAVGDGFVVTGSADGVARTVDVATTTVVTTVEVPGLRALVPLGGSIFAAGRVDGVVDVVDGATGLVTERFSPGEASAVSSLARVDAGHVASGHLDGQVRVHVLGTGSSETSAHHSQPIRSLVRVRAGLLAAGSYDGLVSLCDLRARPVALFDQHEHPIRALASDGEVLCSGDDGGLTCIWRVDAGSLEASNSGPYRGVHRIAILDDSNLVVADFDGAIRLIDGRTGADLVRRRSHTARIRTLVQLAGGDLLTASDDRTIRTWTAAGLEEVSRRTGHLGWVRNAAELADGRIVSTSIDKTVRFWAAGPTESGPTGHRGWIRALVDGGGVVASAAEDGTVRLWDPDDGTCTDSGEVSDGAARCLAAADGRVLAGDDRGALVTWRLSSSCLEDRRVIERAHDSVRGVAVLGSGLSVSAGADGWLRAWRLSDLECVAAFRDEDGGGWRTLTPVGPTTVVAGNERGHVITWDCATLRAARLCGHRGRIWAAAVVGPGRVLTVSFDRTARLWELDPGRQVVEVGDPLGASWGVTAVGTTLVAAASPIGVVRLARAEDLSVVARADIRSAAVSIASAKRTDGRWCVAVGGDAPKPLFLLVRPESIDGAGGDDP